MKKVLFLLLLLAQLPLAHAVALGVNKASINFNDVLKSGYAEDVVTATTDSEEYVNIEYQFTGPEEDWFTLVPNNKSELKFSSKDPLELTVIVQPPEDAANGVYEAKLRLLTGGFARTGGQFGSTIRASFAVKLRVSITGEEILTCTAGGLGLGDTEEGYPVDFYATVKNTGNVRHLPEFNIDIWDQYQTRVVMSETIEADERILPTRQESYIYTFDHSLPKGQYWASIRETTCDTGTMSTFSILELGGVSDKGEMLRIDNKVKVQTNDIVRIAAIFKNLGSRTVSSKFKGTIEKDGKLVEVIDTDSLNVPPGDTAQLESFFNPKEPGRYEIKGRVIYNNKLTFQKSSILTAYGEAPEITGNAIARAFSNPYQVSMIVIFIAIIGLLVLIRKEKKRRY